MDHRSKLDLSGSDAAAYLRKSRMEEGMATDEVLALSLIHIYKSSDAGSTSSPGTSVCSVTSA